MTPRCLGSELDMDESGLELDSLFGNCLVSTGSMARSKKTLEEWMSCALMCMPGLGAQHYAASLPLIRTVLELVRNQLGLQVDISVDPRPLAGSRDLGIEIEIRDTVSSSWGVIMFQALLRQPSLADLRNSVVVRDAVFKEKIGYRSRRDSREILPSILKIDHCTAHLTSESGKYCAVFSVSARKGHPLRKQLDLLTREFRESGGILNEGMRYVLRDLFAAIEFLHEKGFSPNVAGIDELFYDAGQHFCGGSVTLGNMGMGLIFDVMRPQCNQGNQKDTSIRLANRLITESYLDSNTSDVPADVNKKHLQQIKQKAQSLSETGNEPCESVSVTGIKPAEIARLWNDFCVHPTGHLESGEGGSFSGQAQSSVVLNQARRKSRDLQNILLETLSQFSARLDADAEPQQQKADLQSAVDKGKEATILFFKNKDQPLATGRFGELAYDYLAVSDGTNKVSESQISAHLAISTPIFTPEQEQQIVSCGLRMPVVRRILKHSGWTTKMEKALQGYQEDDEPLQVDLVIEEGKGIGVRVVGKWTKGQGKKRRFAGWYVGRAVRGDVPCGGRRYIVSRVADGTVRCDAEPCEKCPLQWYIDQGIPGPFVNSESHTATLELDRDAAFEHDGLQWIPMFIKRDFTGFASWKYSLAQDSLFA